MKKGIIEYLNSSEINEFLSKEYIFYAHTNESEKELLEEHVNRCKKYFKRILEEKKSEKVFNNIEEIILKDCSGKAKKLFREMIINTIVLHDIGKINIAFQRFKMDNRNLKIKGLERCRDSKHSIYSSLIYIDIFLEKALELSNEDKVVMFPFVLLNAYVISRHHSGLNNFDKFIKDLMELTDENIIEENLGPIEKFYYRKINIKQNFISVLNQSFDEFRKSNLSKENSVKAVNAIYIYERFLLSILVACDYYATSEFQNGLEINDLGNLSNINEFYDVFKSGKIYEDIRTYERVTYGKEKNLDKVHDINILRNDLFLDAERTLVNNIDKSIFYLEAPTGSGKSNVANNLAFKLLEEDRSKDKIIYVYPFNTLVEQNIETLGKIYKNNKEIMDKIAVINSLYPIKMTKTENEDYDFHKYEKALLNRQFLNYPMILTTHVSIFNYFFGSNREEVFPLHQLSNSVIIFDEIQSYKNKIWREIIEFFSVYSDLLNIKMIIMSATLPNLDNLLQGEASSVKLIQDRDKYFSNRIFRNRVNVDYSLLEKEFDYNLLIEKVKEHKGKKILIEFIKKSSAYEFFDLLRESKESLDINSKILLVTGDDNSVERKNIINEVSNCKDVILIATQVIEAGVDIDMDIGMKDISIFDSEEQFLGRINRSCLKSGAIVYFFNKDKASSIYKEDIRKQETLTLLNKGIQEMLSNKSFDNYYNKVNEKLLNITSKNNSLNTESFFNYDVGTLLFENISEKMKVIDKENNDITLFLNSVVDVNGEKLVGKEVWRNYEELLKNNDLSYSEKMVKLSEVRAKMNNFLYRIKTNYNFSYNDRIGDILYIEDGEKYFEDGKLNKKKFESNVGEFI